MLVVNETTHPPFLGSHLPPLYATVHVASLKIGKDTSLERMVRGAKSRQTITPMQQ